MFIPGATRAQELKVRELGEGKMEQRTWPADEQGYVKTQCRGPWNQGPVKWIAPDGTVTVGRPPSARVDGPR